MESRGLTLLQRCDTPLQVAVAHRAVAYGVRSNRTKWQERGAQWEERT
jgi:hypothetical protein